MLGKREASVRSTAHTTLEACDLHPRRACYRMNKYRSNRFVHYHPASSITHGQEINPELRQSRDNKSNSQKLKLERFIKEFTDQKSVAIRVSTNPEQQEEEVEIADRKSGEGEDCLSRKDKFKGILRMERSGKGLSRDLAMRIRNESIYNWNFKRGSNKRPQSKGTKESKGIKESKGAKDNVDESMSQRSKSELAEVDDCRSDYNDLKSRRLRTDNDNTRLTELKEEDRELLEDNQIWEDPEVKAVLEKFNIKDQYQLIDFLESNEEHNGSQYNSSEHLNTLAPSMRPFVSETHHKFNGSTSKLHTLPLITSEDYSTLMKLYSMLPDFKNLGSITQSQFNLKDIKCNPIIKPHDMYPLDKNQVTYTTTYGLNFPNNPNIDSHDLANLTREPFREHALKGIPFYGKTEYQRTIRQQPLETYTSSELAAFFKERTGNNPLRSVKGCNFFSTTYGRQFNHKSLSKEHHPRVKSQLQTSIEHPHEQLQSSYISTTHHQYTKHVPSKRHFANPHKFNTLSRLKTILLLNKSLKKEIAPHLPPKHILL